MNVKFTTKADLEALEAKIGTMRRSVDEAKVIAKGGEEGLKLALTRFKNYRIWIQNKISGNNRRLSVTRMVQNSELAGQEWAMTMVISTFENANSDVMDRMPELNSLEKQLGEWKKLPIRD